MPRSSSRAAAKNGSGVPKPVVTSLLQGREPSHEPDVFLNVPELHVGEIELDVENLCVDLALYARLANLVHLQAGAHVEIAKVYLDIKDIDAKAMLKVRLDNVYSILDRALTTLDRNPRILEGIVETADDALGPGGALSSTLQGVGDSLGNLTNGLGEGIGGVGKRARSLRTLAARVRALPRVATAAGVVGGIALAVHSNGGIDKTLKELIA
jgi:hypothetical protein